MISQFKIFKVFLNPSSFCNKKCYSTTKKFEIPKSVNTGDYRRPRCKGCIDDVTGLTAECFKSKSDTSSAHDEIKVSSDEISKCGIYKNPEYFDYHQFSFVEAMVELKKYRLPQPSAEKHIK